MPCPSPFPAPVTTAVFPTRENRSRMPMFDPPMQKYWS